MLKNKTFLNLSFQTIAMFLIFLTLVRLPLEHIQATPYVFFLLAILICALPLGHLFQEDLNDGTLEQYFVKNEGILYGYVLRRLLHFCGYIITPLAFLIAGGAYLNDFTATPLISTFILSAATLLCWGGVGAALGMGPGHFVSLIAIVVLPLSVPNLLISQVLIESGSELSLWLIQGGLFVLSLSTALILTPLALRQNLGTL